MSQAGYILFDAAHFNGEEGTVTDSWLGWSAEVHQATGMIVAQTGVSIAEALRRLVDHAEVGGRTVQDVALDVIAGRLRFGGSRRPRPNGD